MTPDPDQRPDPNDSLDAYEAALEADADPNRSYDEYVRRLEEGPESDE